MYPSPRINLTDGSHTAYTYAIYVDDSGVVYVAGYEVLDKYVAKYWKHDGGAVTEISLTNGSNNAQAQSIRVIDGHVYVAGYESNGTKAVAKYWKDGAATSLTNGSNTAQAFSIFVVKE
jgi:hypothetical protein